MGMFGEFVREDEGFEKFGDEGIGFARVANTRDRCSIAAAKLPSTT